ncbi:hypothetical protein Q5P01_016241 [Channa striata]|uniref:FSD1L n=1 Tax=Channa striata TaxID=64152 RepID=A0AA88MGN1_CHASR|nr:hypothetical protein Q5P01_016241 [Channa striata]
MADQKESLRKITHTLAMKNEEISNFICTIKQSLDNLEANSNRVQEDLESEFTSLHLVLNEMKENMLTRIKQERASRTYELQSQLTACSKALRVQRSCWSWPTRRCAPLRRTDSLRRPKTLRIV